MLSALVAAIVAFSGSAGAAEAAPRPVPFQRGMTVAEWGPTAYEATASAAFFQRLRTQYRVNSVTLLVVWTQADKYSVTVEPGTVTVPTENLVAAIRSARAAGLRVLLRPYVDPRDGSWRGALKPTSVTNWFASYRRFMLSYARLAQQEGVSGLVVGSEMSTLAKYGANWRALVGAVRLRFKGFVTYQANWYLEPQWIKWWKSVDAISISAYYPLTTRTTYTTDQLVRGWRAYYGYGRVKNWFATVQALRNTYQRPIIFGEIGYRTVWGTARQPWNVHLVGAYSEAAQNNAYRAAFRVWYKVPWFRGFQWWYTNPQPRLLDARVGADHRPVSATLSTVALWYARPR